MMPPKYEQQSNRRRAPLATSYCSTIYSNSTSCTEISSPAVSSRVLYHESFGRPVTSKSLPPPSEEARQSSPLGKNNIDRSHHHTNSAEEYRMKRTATWKDKSTDSSWHFGKNMNNSKSGNRQQIHKNDDNKMAGMITTEEEFEALPIAVQRKFFSTLERLRFAQSSSEEQESGRHVDEPAFHHYSQRDRPSTQGSSLAERRGNSRVSIINTGRRSASVSHGNPSRSRKLKKSPVYIPPNQFSPSSPDTPDSPRTWFMTLPEKIQQSQFSREEQIALAGRLREGRGNRGRESVILDAADEAILKATLSRQANRFKRKEPEKQRGSPLPESLRSSIDSSYEMDRSGLNVVDEERRLEEGSEIDDTYNPYDSFRWLDEESDLDLRLKNHLDTNTSLPLDDYHANLCESVPSPTSNRRPSFRRHLSISKIPFGGNANVRNSLSSPNSPIAWAAPPLRNHEPKKSRALSLLPAKHSHIAKEDGVEGHQDPNATHWQDPDARLKLRVYLASPQKFDEAIEFGFPSLERDASCTPITDNKENRPPYGRKESRESSRYRHGGGESLGTATTFLNDDDELVFGEDEDDMSMIDPDSPKTPQEMGDAYNPVHHRSLTSHSNSNSHVRFASKGSSSHSGSARVSRERNGDERDYSHLGITKPILHKRADTDGFLGLSSGESRTGMTYMQQPVGPGNREMTLRMTLTRPDLRSDIPPPVPEKDRPLERLGIGHGNASNYGSTTGFTSLSGNSSLGGNVSGIGNIGWQHAITQTTITAGKPSDVEDADRERWEEKFEGVRGPFGGPDGWGPEKGEGGGVVKRFWKKVKSSQKKNSA